MTFTVPGIGITTSLELRGFKVVRKGLESFIEGSVQVGVKTIYDIVSEWRKALATYPPKYAGEPPMDMSAKQRRWFFWALREGLIEVPYHRTGHYGWSWRTERDKSISAKEGIGYRLYNDVVDKASKPYATYVAGDEALPQAPIHIGRWMSTVEAIDALREEIPAMIQENISMAARKAGL